MVGGPSQTSMKLWARTSGPAEISFNYGFKQDQLNLQSLTNTRAAHDFAGFVTLTNLQPGKKYFFQSLINGKASGKMGL